MNMLLIRCATLAATVCFLGFVEVGNEGGIEGGAGKRVNGMKEVRGGDKVVVKI